MTTPSRTHEHSARHRNVSTMTEPVTASVIMAKALIAPTVSWLVRQAPRWLKPTIGSPSRKVVGEAAVWFDEHLRADDQLGTKIPHAYLRSPEFTTLLRQIIVFKVSGRIVTEDGPLLSETRVGLELYGEDGFDIEACQSLLRLTTGLADLLLEYCGLSTDDLNDSIDKEGHRAALESYLLSIDNQIRHLSEPAAISMQEISDSLSRYRVSAAKAFGKIQPPNTEGAAPVPINNLYVAPSLDMSSKGQHRRPELHELLDLPRCAILGDPGGGKTTLVRKLSFDLITGGDEYANLIPVVVVLRDFGAHLRQNGGTVAQYLSEVFRSAHQTDLSPRAIEWCLNTGQFYVIFDGLDELLETESRQRIAQVIDSFEAVYPDCRILVTSRRVGYSQAPLDDSVFQVVQLGDLDGDRVTDYVNKWFETQSELTPEQRKKMASSFIEESRLVDDLRRNPLMLALMCTIYRAESYIPRNRPDVYEKCSRMLFDRWDRHRGLLKPFEFEAHVEPALMEIAYRVYQDPDIQTGLPESQLVDMAADYLEAWQFDDTVKARHAAREFITFCRGRAWVFTDVGLDAAEESLYQFTHRTFLEFFAASHLARTQATVESLCEFLLPHLEQSGWDVVGQLAIQVKTRGLQGGPDEAVNRLLRFVSESDSRVSRFNVLSFVSRSLSFLVTSPSTTRMAVSAIIAEGFEIIGNASSDSSNASSDPNDVANQTEFEPGRVIDGLLTPLKLATREIKRIVYETYIRSLAAALSREEGLALESACYVSATMEETQGELDPWGTDSEEKSGLTASFLSHMRQHELDWPWANLWRFYTGGDLSFERLYELERHGATILPTPIMGGGAFYLAPAVVAANSMAHNACTAEATWSIDEIGALVTTAAEWILTNPPRNAAGRNAFPFMYGRESDEPDQHREYTELELLSGLVVLAAASEANSQARSLIESFSQARSLIESLSRISVGHFEALGDMVSNSAATVHFDNENAMLLYNRLRSWCLQGETFCPLETTGGENLGGQP